METDFSFLLDYIIHLDRYLPILVASCGPWLYVLLFLVVFCETGLVITPFLPGDSLLFACGALAAALENALNCGTCALVFGVAAVLGDACNYYIGEKLGEQLLAHKTPFIKPQHIKQAADFYARHGHKAIFLARFVPIVRTFAPFVAGIGKMHYLTFAQYNVIGAVCWVALFVGGGYVFGNIPVIKENFSLVTLGIVFVSLLPVIYEVSSQHLRSHK